MLYDNQMIFTEASGLFLRTIIERGAWCRGSCDFIFATEQVAYRFADVEGSLRAVDIRVDGKEIDPKGWYAILVNDYVLNTVLKDPPNRDGGLRHQRPGTESF